MALNPTILASDIEKALKIRTDLQGKGEANPEMIEKQVAQLLAIAIDKYIRSATVVVNPGIPTAGSPTAQVTVAPGQGKIT